MSVEDLVLSAGARTQGQVTPRMLTAAGLPSADVSRAVAGGELVRIRRRVYALAHLPPLPRYVVTKDGVAPAYVAHVRAVLLSLGGQSAASGRTAAALRGWGLFIEPSRTIDVAVQHGRSRARLKNVRISQRRQLDVEHRVVLPETEPLTLTSAVGTVIDCCLELSAIEAVVVGDSALRAGDVTSAELEAAARSLIGVGDAARVRHVLRLLDAQSGSVLESVLRYRLLTGGLIGFKTQYVVSRPGSKALRVDFCFEAVRLVIEADGAKWHPDPGPDRIRDNSLAISGFRVLRYTWAEIVHDHERVLREIERAVRGKDFHPVARGEVSPREARAAAA